MSYRVCSQLKNKSLLSRMINVFDFEFQKTVLFKNKLLKYFALGKTLTNYSHLCGSNDLKKDNLSSDCIILGHSNDVVSDTKLIKVAIVGTPNSGKSTLINRLVNRRVCPISSKVHTTRNKTKAILNERNVQVILLDTPGLVDISNSKRHNLEKSFLVDAELCIKESDLIAVIHDVSNVWTRDRLDLKVLRLLHLHREKSSILILNKVDVLKSKRKLLDLTHSLICGSLKSDISETDDLMNSTYIYGGCVKDNNNNLNLTEKAVHKAIISETGWPNFERVFMISALTGSGVNAMKEFILLKGIPRPWIYPSSVFTDQKMEEIIVLAVKEKLLEFLPKEIPYSVRINLEHLSISPAGDVIAVVLLNCNNKRQQKLLIGTAGQKIKEIAKAAEKALENTFMENVKLKIVVQMKK